MKKSCCSWEGIKPGWTRINFNYFISENVRDYLIEAVELIARHGHRLLPDYVFHPDTGLWRHRKGPAQPPLRLTDVFYDDSGALRCPTEGGTLGEEYLVDHLRVARALLAACPNETADDVTDLPSHFESLRWFPLPPQCLARVNG